MTSADDDTLPARRGLLARALARFDTATLLPPDAPDAADAPAAAPPQDTAAWAALQAWCNDGPARLAHLAVATLQGPGAAALANRLCLELDGSLQMLATDGAGRLLLRLKTKFNDLLPWRTRRGTDPWDCGTLITSPAGLQALRRYTPRRATLVVVHTLPPADLHAVVALLRRNQAAYAHGLRLLLVNPGVAVAQATSIACR